MIFRDRWKIRGIADLKRNPWNSKNKCQSHMDLFCCPDHTQRWLCCASFIVHSRVNSILFLPFTALIVPFSSVHCANCAILTVHSLHFLSIYRDFIEFNVANFYETDSKQNFIFFKRKIAFFETENQPYMFNRVFAIAWYSGWRAWTNLLEELVSFNFQNRQI